MRSYTQQSSPAELELGVLQVREALLTGKRAVYWLLATLQSHHPPWAAPLLAQGAPRGSPSPRPVRRAAPPLRWREGRWGGPGPTPADSPRVATWQPTRQAGRDRPRFALPGAHCAHADAAQCATQVTHTS
jgi:hypothetical protein